jgi:hypothetical protein
MTLKIAGLMVLLLAGAAPAHAGAWLQEPGTAYLRFSTGLLATRERFDAGGDRVQWDTSGGGFRDARYRDLAAGLYGEFGVARDWNLILSGGWSRLEAEQPSAVFTTFGFTDFTLGVKRALRVRPRFVTSVAAAISVPTGYDTDEYPALGSGETEFGVAALAGTSGNRFWGTAELEYRFRGGIFRDQLRGAMGGGFNPRPGLGLRGEVRGGAVTGSGSTRATSEGVRFDPTTVDPSHLDLAATVSVAVGKGLAVEGEVRSTVAGENTLAGTRWSLALATHPVLRWKR